MRIEALSTLVAVVWLTAVLCPRLIAANNLSSSHSSRRPKDHPYRGHISHWAEETTNYKRMTYRKMQTILREEGGEDGLPVDCCPTVEEMVEPVGGRNRQDMYVELYRSGKDAQRFFEYSCKEDVVDKPCRFVDWKFRNQSRCVQKFSYVYAIIESPERVNTEPNTAPPEIEVEEHRRHHHREHHHFPSPLNIVNGTGWTLDYIRVRSGCSCEIVPKPKKRKITAIKAKKTKSKQHQPKDQGLDFDT